MAASAPASSLLAASSASKPADERGVDTFKTLREAAAAIPVVRAALEEAEAPLTPPPQRRALI